MQSAKSPCLLPWTLQALLKAQFYPHLQASGKSPIHSFYLFTFTVMQLIAQSQSPVFLAACLMTEDAVVFIKPAYAPFIFSLETHFYRQS